MKKEKRMEIQISVIGGGSKLWALTLMKDLSMEPALSGRLKLYDINHQNALSNVELSKRIFQNPQAKTSFQVSAEKTAEEALKGSDFVILSLEPGPTEARYTDLVIPAEYGILQSVGDTIGPGGIFRAQRAIPVFRNYARMIKKHCPQAWVINYTNPMTWCTQTLVREEPSLKVLGCCHEVFGTQKFIAQKVSEIYKVKTPHHKEIKLDVCGLNHFTFALSAYWKNHDLYPQLKELANSKDAQSDRTQTALDRKDKEEWFESDKHIALELLRLFDNLGAAGDRHLAEFLPWYLKEESELHRYGVVLTPYRWRVENAKEKQEKVYTDDDLTPEASDEEGVTIIKALLGLGSLYTNVNVPNRGQIPWLPQNHVVETNALIDQNSILPSTAGMPSAPVKQFISTIAEEQELVLKGVFEENPQALFQAFLMDPLMQLPISKAKELYMKMEKKQIELMKNYQG